MAVGGDAIRDSGLFTQTLAEALDERQDLRLTRRAAVPGPLALPAGEAHNPGESACFRRAA